MPRTPARFLRSPLCLLALAMAGCGGHNDSASDGPTSTEAAVVHQTGNAAAGKQVFSFETFGNERFWTDAVRLQQGMMAAGVTPMQALALGLSVDIEGSMPFRVERDTLI